MRRVLSILVDRSQLLGLAGALPVKELAATIALTGLLIFAGMTIRIDHAVSDAWFEVNHAAPTGRVMLVDIAQLARVRGDGLRIPRALLAELLRRLDAGGVGRVLIELSLQGETTPTDDAALDAAVGLLGANRVAITKFATLTSDQTGQARWNRTDVAERFAGRATLAASDLAFDSDNHLRRYGVASSGLPPLITGASWLSGGSVTGTPVRSIDFGIDARKIPFVDAFDLLDNRIGSEALRGTQVILTSFSSALGSEIHVPRFGLLRRAQITALATETLLRGRELRSPSLPARLLLVLTLASVATVWSSRLGFLAGTAVATGLSLCLFALAASQQASSGLVLPIAEPVLAIFIGHLTLQASRNPMLGHTRDACMRWSSRSDLQLARALDDAGEALVTFTSDGEILSVNNAAKRLLGTTSQVRGAQLTELLGVPADGLVAAAKQSQPGRLVATVNGSTGAHRHFDLTVNAMPGGKRTWVGVAAIRDVTEQQVQIEALRRMASEDPLTGLANRLRFEDVLARTCAQLPSERGEHITHDSVAVMMCDLDGFKGVNDTLGHQAGDTLLREIAGRLRSRIGPHATVARLGGDEFALIVSADMMTAADARVQANELVLAVAKPILIDGTPVTVGISIGIALGPSMGSTPIELNRIADAAMYRAKRTKTGLAIGIDRDTISSVDRRINVG